MMALSGQRAHLVFAWVAFASAMSPAFSQSQAEQQAVQDVCDKRIVVLGELPSHGEARAFVAKSWIAQKLIQDCGFDALFFEAPIYDFLGFEAAVAQGNADRAALDQAIGGFWLNHELADWRNWLFSQAAAGLLVLGGLDDQVSATSVFARSTLPELIGEQVPEQDPGHIPEHIPGCRDTVERNLFWRYSDAEPFSEAEQTRLLRCARRAHAALASVEAIEVSSADTVMAQNLANLYARSFGEIDAVPRDATMAGNLRWHLSRLPDEARVVIWTSTVHAARKRAHLPWQPMGALLDQRFGDKLAVLGFSAFSGESSMAGMPARLLEQSPEGSLEALATRATENWTYLDDAALKALGVVESRLFGGLSSANWSELFDGVLVIREEVAPLF